MSGAGEDPLAPDLRAGLVALSLSLGEHRQRLLLGHLRLIERWNRVYNLTAVRDPGEMLEQHVLDSLAVVPPLRRELAKRSGALRLLDVGSGAGLPGIALAIACADLKVTSVDAVGKKASFMRQVGAELGLPNFEAVHGRVESLADEPYSVIACRAFSSLEDLIRLTRHLLASDGVWLAMKGRAPVDEMKALPDGVEVFHVEPLHVPGLGAERCIVWMRRRGLTVAADQPENATRPTSG